MKNLILLMLISTLNMYASSSYAQQTKLSLELESSELKDVLREIRQQTDFTVLYRSSDVNEVTGINKSFEDATVMEILDECLKGTELGYEIKDKVIVIHPVESIEYTKPIEETKQEKKELKGTVTDADGNTLPGVSVVVKGTMNGTATDIDGNYTIEVEGKSIVLVFSFVGMLPQEIAYAGQASIDVVLKADSENLDEVVIVGYGSTRKKDLTGTVGTVKAESLGLIKTQSVEGALSGQLAGVFVSPSSGEPGSGSTIHIRGLSQIKGDNQPLYVIDGVPVIVNSQLNTAGGENQARGLDQTGTSVNPMLSIDPSNVERIDILKDASAAAIYGSRGANGVILVTTKKGKHGQAPRLTFSVNSTIQNPSKSRDWASGPEFIDFMTSLAEFNRDNGGISPFGPEFEILNDAANYFGTADTDWEDKIVNKNALWNTYNLRVSGGGDKVIYALAASVNEQEGIIIKNKLKRYNFNANISAQVNKHLKIGGSINYNYMINKSSGLASLNSSNYRPDLAVFNEDGTFTSYLDRGLSELNPLGGDGRNTNKTIGQNVLGSLFGEVKLLENLKFKSQLNITTSTSGTKRFVPSFNNEFNAVVLNRPGATLNIQNNSSWATSFENTLNFNKTINDLHRIDAIVGMSWDQSKIEYDNIALRGFPDDTNLINGGSAAIAEFPASAHNQNGLNSIFGRFNYVYNDKYLATFTARRDVSTKFGPGNRAGFFPSGALAWNMHNEDFIKNIESINLLKVRSSFGITGSDNLRSFSYLPYYNGGVFYAGTVGMRVNDLPNRDIKWEETSQLDLGLEFGLFNSRLNGEIVYFEKNTSGIILDTPVTAETGAEFWSNNVGDVSNKGWEFVLSGDIFRTKDFTWNSSFNISFITNKVEKLRGGSTDGGFNVGIVEGEPIGVITGKVVEGIAQTQEEITALNLAAGGIYDRNLRAPGDYIMKDLDGDGVITSAGDRKVLGDLNPDYYGGWNNNFTYKNWNLGMNWAFAYGIEKDYSLISWGWYFNNFKSNVDKLALKETWLPGNPDAKYARYGSFSHLAPNTRSVQDASYIKLRSLSIGYSLPKSLLDKIGISNARFSLSGNNLLTITNYDGLDPEAADRNSFSTSTSGQNEDSGRSYPNATSYTIGLNVTF